MSQILNSEQAAELVGAETSTIEQLFRDGIAPAAKFGRAWVTTDVDFFNFVSAKCKANVKATQCHSTSAVKFGGRSTQSTDVQLENLLDTPTKNSPKKRQNGLKIVK